MLEELQAAGLKRRHLAKRLELSGITPQLLTHYRNGTQPLYPRGHAIIALWCELTGKSESEVPMIDWSQPYRTKRASRAAVPKLQSLPAWPFGSVG